MPKTDPIVKLYPFQQRLVESPSRFTWSCWSRQVGKSFATSLRRVIRGGTTGRNQILMSASERQSVELMRKVQQHCQALKIAAGNHQVDPITKAQEVTIPGGARVIALPANPETIRGYTGDVLLDEYAMHDDDKAIWAAVFPTITRAKGELDIASTPRGVDNQFAKLRANETFDRSTLTIHDAIADGLDIDADAIKRALSDDLVWRQEYECEFLDEAYALLSYATIRDCERDELRTELDVEANTRQRSYFLGIDIGRFRDLTVLWVLEQLAGELITRGIIELAECAFSEQKRRASELLRMPGLRRCCIDAGGLGLQLAEELVNDFGDRVEPVSFTNPIKEDLAGRVRVRFERKQIAIPCSDTVRRDLHSIRRTVLPSGAFRFDAKRSELGHADRFWALALAIYATSDSIGPAEYVGSDRKLTFARSGVW